MPTSAITQHELLTTDLLATRSTAQWLVSALDTTASVWSSEGNWSLLGYWEKHGEESLRTTGQLKFHENDLCATVDSMEAVREGLCQQYPDELGPIAFALPNGQHALAISVETKNTMQPSLVVVAIAEDDTTAILCQLAEFARERAEFCQSYEQLRDDFEVCTSQMSDNFEELSFLRNIADTLEAATLDHEVTDMARGVLPLLRTCIKAEEVILYFDPKLGNTAPEQFTKPDYRCGKGNIPDEICNTILSDYAHKSYEQPTVVNHLKNNGLFPGITTFILTPVSKSGTVLGWLIAINRDYRTGFENADFISHLSEHEFGTVEAGLVSSAASILASQGYNCELYRQREELLVKVVRALVNAIEAKDPYTCGHSERVALFATTLAKAVGQSEAERERIYLSGLLHDVGKIGIQDATLQKPGILTKEEYDEIKKHPDLGWNILSELTQLSYILPGVVHHHERIDGKGYPDGLIGKAIPTDGRIMAVADAFDAMTSNRSYRQGMSNEKAIAILKDGAGTQWDKEYVEAFLEIMPEIETIQKNYALPKHPIRTGPVLQERL